MYPYIVNLHFLPRLQFQQYVGRDIFIASSESRGFGHRDLEDFGFVLEAQDVEREAEEAVGKGDQAGGVG